MTTSMQSRSLKAELVLKGITITELARRMNRSRTYVSQLVNGRRKMRKDVAEYMAMKTGIPLSVILPQEAV